jgi:hypothetical protein
MANAVSTPELGCHLQRAVRRLSPQAFFAPGIRCKPWEIAAIIRGGSVPASLSTTLLSRAAICAMFATESVGSNVRHP